MSQALCLSTVQQIEPDWTERDPASLDTVQHRILDELKEPVSDDRPELTLVYLTERASSSSSSSPEEQESVSAAEERLRWMDALIAAALTSPSIAEITLMAVTVTPALRAWAALTAVAGSTAEMEAWQQLEALYVDRTYVVNQNDSQLLMLQPRQSYTMIADAASREWLK